MSISMNKKYSAHGKDWHPADVIAALRKSGTSLRQISISQGYRPASLSAALHRPWPKAERTIAAVLGLSPHSIWPSRYDASGQPNRPFGRPRKNTNGISGRNVNLTGAN
jgi:Ner family transcriptional regulator